MRNRKLVIKILAGLLVAGMLIGLLPMFVSAAEVDFADDSGVTTTLIGDQVPEEPEIDIENPETTDAPSFEDEVREKIEALVARLFQSVRDWFNY